MKKALLGAVLCGLLLQAAPLLVMAAEPFRDDKPESYTVVKGDTLWDISGRFLDNPWDWPDVWELNPQINNPHLIYPGDVVHLVYIDGKPRLTVSRGQTGRTIKLGPEVRSTPLADAIPAIPLDAINNFLNTSQVIESHDDLKLAPYILSNGQERVISGAGDTVYARGQFAQGNRIYGVFRGEKPYTDPKTGAYLGSLVHGVGTLTLNNLENDVATMSVTRSNEELRVGDRLLVSEERRLATSFFPAAPENKNVEGTILDVVKGVNQIGLYDNVVVNLGDSQGMRDGDVLAIYRSNKVKDPVTKEFVTLPAERVGHLMLFRTYQNLSFAVVMQASLPLHTGDTLRAP